MTKKQLQKEWGRITSEIHEKPKYRTPYYQKIVRVRELLLHAQTILCEIETKYKAVHYEKLYQKIISEYYRQKKCLKI